MIGLRLQLAALAGAVVIGNFEDPKVAICINPRGRRTITRSRNACDRLCIAYGQCTDAQAKPRVFNATMVMASPRRGW
jgi:hypothetical protein